VQAHKEAEHPYVNPSILDGPLERALETLRGPSTGQSSPRTDDIYQVPQDIQDFNRRMAEAGRGPTPPSPGGQDWHTPLTVHTLKRQSDALLDDFMDDETWPELPYHSFKAIKTTLKGARAQAYAGALFKGELLKTQAAQAAYNSRKLGSRKILLAGGPVYAEDARRMKKQRQDNAQQEEALALVAKLELQRKRAEQKFYIEVLPALIKFTQKKLQPVYIFKGDHRPLSRVF